MKSKFFCIFSIRFHANRKTTTRPDQNYYVVYYKYKRTAKDESKYIWEFLADLSLEKEIDYSNP